MIYKNYLGIFIGLLIFTVIAAILSIRGNSSETGVLSSNIKLIDFEGIDVNTPNKQFSIYVTGDLMPGRYVNIQTKASKDPMWAYNDILSYLEGKFVFSNLESPITRDCKDKSDGMIFCAPEYAAESLSKSGIDIVSLANNHILNQGTNGLLETQVLLDKYGVKYTGVKNPTIIEHENMTISFLGFDDVECNPKYIECANEENIKSDILDAKEKSDFVIIMFHWGTEYRYEPSSRQIHLAHFSVDNGADLVLGNHPHWYQKLERFQDKLIAYSHGNFIFDQMWSKQTREGIIAEYKFKNNIVSDYDISPILISNHGQPKLYDEPNKQRIINHLKSISLTQ